MLYHGVNDRRRWTSASVKMETELGDVVLIAPCGARRKMSPTEARSLALRLQDMASVAEREGMRIRSNRRTPKGWDYRAQLRNIGIDAP